MQLSLLSLVWAIQKIFLSCTCGLCFRPVMIHDLRHLLPFCSGFSDQSWFLGRAHIQPGGEGGSSLPFLPCRWCYEFILEATVLSSLKCTWVNSLKTHLGEPFKKAPGSALSSRTRWQTPDWLWSSSRSCSERCHIINTMLATFWILNISNIGTLAALWIAVKSSSVSTQASSTAGSASGLIMIEYHHDPECDIRKNFDTNECPNIFVSTKLHEWISEYIHIDFLTRTNVRIIIRIENCTNIRIYSNIRLGFTL